MKASQPSKFWWLRRFKYVAILLRELTSVFILAYVLLYLEILSQMPSGSRNVVSQLGTAPFLVLSILIMGFSLYHSITWFTLLPKIQPMKLGSFLIRGPLALLINIAVLVIASLLVASLIFGIGITVGPG